LESSYGPFQLNRRRGLGVEFEKDTAAIRARLGLGNLTDPRTIPLQAYWVANYLKSHGTGAWMGFHGLRNADPRWGESGYDASKIPGYKEVTGKDPPPAPTGAGPGAPGHIDSVSEFRKKLDSGQFDAPGFGTKAFTMPHRPGHAPAPYDSSIGKEASLLRASRQANGSSKVSGEARLSIELAGGLRPSRGVENKGSLFKEIAITRSSSPTSLASSEG
jgi:hypothetical protein